MYIDASNMVAGRLASGIAKELLKGKRVVVVNAEKAVVSGEPEYSMQDYTEKIERGDPYHGPFYPKEPDRILKRIIRGMLPYRKGRGKDAFKRLKVFISVPADLKGKEFAVIKGAENKLECKSIGLGRLSQKLGAKKSW